MFLCDIMQFFEQHQIHIIIIVLAVYIKHFKMEHYSNHFIIPIDTLQINHNTFEFLILYLFYCLCSFVLITLKTLVSQVQKLSNPPLRKVNASLVIYLPLNFFDGPGILKQEGQGNFAKTECNHAHA